jgi:nucleoside-diphosphate-sugar epimerase
MKILVTGNLGYIGPVLTRELVSRGHEVHGFDSGLFAPFATEALPRLASQTVADLRDTPALRRAIAACEVVIHLAAMSNDPLGELDPSVTRSVNLDATLELIHASRDRRLVLYSSASVYGVNDDPCDENAPVHPLTLYSELKVAAERAALAAPNALVQRNGTVHGPAPVIRGDLLLNAMVASAAVTDRIMLLTTPDTMRPVIDVRDLAYVTAELLQRHVTGLYNVASENVSVGAVARLVAQRTGAELVERHDGADARDYAMDTSRLQAIAPWWRPRSLAVAIDDLIWHYGKMRLTSHDVSERKYHRLVQYRLAVREPVSTTPRR